MSNAEDWWWDEHCVIRNDTWRERLGGWFYRIGDWIWRRGSCHDVVIRDQHGRELMHVCGRIPSFNVPPPPYTVWCCEGRIDDGHGNIRKDRRPDHA